MKIRSIAFALLSLAVLASCKDLTQFDLYPELTNGSWRLVEQELANGANADTCWVDDDMIFEDDGDFQRTYGTCRDLGQQDATGRWTFRKDGEELVVKMTAQFQGGSARWTHEFEASIRQDTLFLLESFEDGTDRYVLVRE